MLAAFGAYSVPSGRGGCQSTLRFETIDPIYRLWEARSGSKQIGGEKVQSADLLRKLGEVDRELIEGRVRMFCELRANGDLSSMLEYAAPDVTCFMRGHWSLAVYPRPLVGKEAVAEAYRQLNIRYENLGSIVHELLIDGDRVALHRTTSIRNRGGGQEHTFDVINFMRFRDGLVVEFSEYCDPAAIAALNEADS
jgi:ketosteroid isomerase-like protein